MSYGLDGVIGMMEANNDRLRRIEMFAEATKDAAEETRDLMRNIKSDINLLAFIAQWAFFFHFAPAAYGWLKEFLGPVIGRLFN